MRLLLLMLRISVYVVAIGTRAEAQNIPGARFTARELAAARIAVSAPSRTASADKASKALSLLSARLPN